MEGVEFTIVRAPVSIVFDCPHCGAASAEVAWCEVDEPECWSDDWGEVECPYCGKTVKLGEAEID